MASVKLTARHPQVYEPCDDSFALEDALAASSSSIASLRPSICLEIGSGSGYVLTSLCSLLDKLSLLNSAQVFATDISSAAAETTKSTLRNHGYTAELVITDVTRGLDSGLQGAVDLIICNPPYVVTSSAEVAKGGIAAAWAGGLDGREVIDRILPACANLLSPRGMLFLVAVSENKPGAIRDWMGNLGFNSETTLVKRTEEEALSVLRFWRK